MKKHAIALLMPLTAFLLTGCGGENYTVHVKNLTGVEISDIQIVPETDKSDMKNLLKENLPVDGEIDLSIGRLTEEDTANGFYLLVTNAEDGSEGTFSMLHFDSGETISFYLDDWGLAVGVNMTDEEIEEQKQRDHEDYLQMVEEEASAAAAEEASEEAAAEAEKASEEAAASEKASEEEASETDAEEETAE